MFASKAVLIIIKNKMCPKSQMITDTFYPSIVNLIFKITMFVVVCYNLGLGLFLSKCLDQLGFLSFIIISGLNCFRLKNYKYDGNYDEVVVLRILINAVL